MVIFGSGGHTSEMLFLLKDYDAIKRCKKIYFVKASSDILCENKVKHFLEDHKVPFFSINSGSNQFQPNTMDCYSSQQGSQAKLHLFCFHHLICTRGHLLQTSQSQAIGRYHHKWPRHLHTGCLFFSHLICTPHTFITIRSYS
jgi:hypothetical protein